MEYLPGASVQIVKWNFCKRDFVTMDRSQSMDDNLPVLIGARPKQSVARERARLPGAIAEVDPSCQEEPEVRLRSWTRNLHQPGRGVIPSDGMSPM